jgi:hypothetical protein
MATIVCQLSFVSWAEPGSARRFLELGTDALLP